MDQVAYKRPAKAEFPSYVEPCDPTLRKEAPVGPEWIHDDELVAKVASALSGGAHANVVQLCR